MKAFALFVFDVVLRAFVIIALMIAVSIVINPSGTARFIYGAFHTTHGAHVDVVQEKLHD